MPRRRRRRADEFRLRARAARDARVERAGAHGAGAVPADQESRPTHGGRSASGARFRSSKRSRTPGTRSGISSSFRLGVDERMQPRRWRRTLLTSSTRGGRVRGRRSASRRRARTARRRRADGGSRVPVSSAFRTLTISSKPRRWRISRSSTRSTQAATPAASSTPCRSRARLRSAPSCSDEGRFFVYLNARELVHTANEIRGSGATIASLGQDLEGLGLRAALDRRRGARGTRLDGDGVLERPAVESRRTLERAAVRCARVRRRESVSSRSAAAIAARERQRRARGGRGRRRAGRRDLRPLGRVLERRLRLRQQGADAARGCVRLRRVRAHARRRLSPAEQRCLGGIFGLSEQAVDFDETASDISVVDGNIDAEGTSRFCSRCSKASVST